MISAILPLVTGSLPFNTSSKGQLFTFIILLRVNLLKKRQAIADALQVD
jgi:hypothetical protein